MTDRELLEMAAKAAGINIVWYSASPSIQEYPVLASKDKRPTSYGWNPLTDDGDALRLAVKLAILVCTRAGRAIANHDDLLEAIREFYDTDPYAATRRAIVRAAAEIGKEMP